MNVDKIFFRHDTLKVRVAKMISSPVTPDTIKLTETITASEPIKKIQYGWSGKIPIGSMEMPKIKIRSKKVDPAKVKYYERVWEITERHALKVKNIHLRGPEYHLDHIVPISYGFKKNINPAIIGGFKNLRIITRKENFRKNCQFVTL